MQRGGSRAAPATRAFESRSPGRASGRGLTAPLVVLVVTFVALSALPARASTLTLRDGSTITGEIVAVNDGVYTVRSPTLGTLAIKQSDVGSLTNDAPKQVPAELNALEERIAADPDAMSSITVLQDDPALQAILGDADVVKALQTGNFEALLSNPKLQHLATDPRIQALTEKLAR